MLAAERGGEALLLCVRQWPGLEEDVQTSFVCKKR
jgi:hypothetical protein